MSLRRGLFRGSGLRNKSQVLNCIFFWATFRRFFLLPRVGLLDARETVLPPTDFPPLLLPPLLADLLRGRATNSSFDPQCGQRVPGPVNSIGCKPTFAIHVDLGHRLSGLGCHRGPLRKVYPPAVPRDRDHWCTAGLTGMFYLLGSGRDDDCCLKTDGPGRSMLIRGTTADIGRCPVMHGRSKSLLEENYENTERGKIVGESTLIAWADSTWNPWQGCTRCSPGCANCYAAERDVRNLTKTGSHWGKGAPRRITAESGWQKPVTWNRKCQEQGTRLRVFGCDLCDWCDEEAPEGIRMRFWELIRSTPNLDWLLLTKRAERISELLPGDWGSGYPNVWLGVTVENRAQGLPRIDILRDVPAVCRFLSVEPLLEDLGELDLTGISWAIIGGESGHKARPFRVEWAQSILRRMSGTRYGAVHQAVGCPTNIPRPNHPLETP